MQSACLLASKVDEDLREPGSAVEVRPCRDQLTFEEGEYSRSAAQRSAKARCSTCRCWTPHSGRLHPRNAMSPNSTTMPFPNRSPVGFVFQSFNLIPQLTVLENLESRCFTGRDPHVRHERSFLTMIEKVARHLASPPMQLSGGSSSASPSPALSTIRSSFCDEPP